MLTVVLKNNFSSVVGVEDLGFSIPASGVIEVVGINGTFDYVEIAESRDVHSHVQSGILTVNDGSEDLTIVNGIQHISLESEYTGTDVSVSGISDENIDGGMADTIYLGSQQIDGGNA